MNAEKFWSKLAECELFNLNVLDDPISDHISTWFKNTFLIEDRDTRGLLCLSSGSDSDEELSSNFRRCPVDFVGGFFIGEDVVGYWFGDGSCMETEWLLMFDRTTGKLLGACSNDAEELLDFKFMEDPGLEEDNIILYQHEDLVRRMEQWQFKMKSL
jgi:hypothetical protein